MKPLSYKPCSALMPLGPLAANTCALTQYIQTHMLSLSVSLSFCALPPAPVHVTCPHIPSQHLAWHLALLSLSEQFKWIIRLVMRRKWIVHLLIWDQSPLSCSQCRIRLALCEVTPDSVQHCSTLWVPVDSWSLAPLPQGDGLPSLTADTFHSPRWETNSRSPLSAPHVQMLIWIIINKGRQHAWGTVLPVLILLLLSSPSLGSPTKC